MIKKLAVYFKGHGWMILCASVLIVGEVVCELQIPRLMSDIIDVGIANLDNSYILRTVAVMLGICLIAVSIGVINKKLTADISQGFAHKLRTALFNKVQDFSFNNIDEISTASLITRLTNDVNTVQSIALQIMRLLVRSPIMMVSALIISLSISTKVSMVLLVSMPLLVLCISVLMVISFRLFAIVRQKLDRMNGRLQENLSGIRVIKSFVREDYEGEKFARNNRELRDSSFKAANIGILNAPISGTIMNATALVVYWLGARLIWGKELETGDLLAISAYIVQIMMSLNMISMVLVHAARAKVCAIRICEVLDTGIDIVSSVDKESSPRVKKGTVEFRGVSFRYRGMKQPALEDISFSAEPGETVAILGGTGSGKSTLVKLLPRFYDPEEGSIFVDGRDIREYHPERLREGIGMVFQNNVLFSGSVMDNLRWGSWAATEEEIEEAAKSAQIHDFVRSLPDGYDTRVNQDGVNVSGGQRQRLCISRALLKKPPILILDDSTSACDVLTEERIKRALAADFADTTVFIIAQRISSVRHADKIIVLDEGRITGIGTHEELLRDNEIYQEINHSQEGGMIAI